eukprot:5133371-Amphidinium_carterae.1
MAIVPKSPDCELLVLDVTDRSNPVEHRFAINAFGKPLIRDSDGQGCYSGGDGKGGFGAAWGYADYNPGASPGANPTVRFAANDGERGVYQVEMDTLDTQAKTVTMSFVGDSVQTTANDGANCYWP